MGVNMKIYVINNESQEYRKLAYLLLTIYRANSVSMLIISFINKTLKNCALIRIEISARFHARKILNKGKQD